MTRQMRGRRFQTIVLSILLASSAFAVEATPTQLPLPRPEALTPQPAKALGCADGPSFEGRLTSSKTSTSAVTRSTSGNVYAYISKVADDWSCTSAYRYDGIGYRRIDVDGNFDWGNLINSTSVACNWAIGSTDYVKGNSSTDCPDSDSEYALPIHFDKTSAGELLETVAHNDSTPDEPGDFMFIHSDCTSYYGGESVRYNHDFAAGTVVNRPGDNCDPISLDAMNYTQAITIDGTAPSLSFTAPAGSAGTIVGSTSTSYGVKFTATDNVAAFGSTHQWSVQRQKTANTAGGTCDTAHWVNDGTALSGTAVTLQTSTQTLAVGSCYRWLFDASDMNGNTATQKISATVIVDATNPQTYFLTAQQGTTVSVNAASYAVRWGETERQSGINTRSLQRQKIGTTSACSSGPTADGSAVTTGTPSTQTLTTLNCYQWAQTLVDKAGNQSTCTSGKVYYETTVPQATFTTPTDTAIAYQTGSSLSVAWTEAAGSGTVTARSLQRQKATGTLDQCSGLSWSNDGSAVTTTSSVSSTGMTDGLYRWTQTLTNSAGKTGMMASGWVVVDTAAPTGSITYPEANRPLAGTVHIAGTATDTGSFKEYQLEYGAGASPSSWTTIGTFTNAVTSSGPLADWPTGTLNGIYTLRLTVRENASATTSVTTRTIFLENAKRGTESYYTRVPYDLGGEWTVDVGVANGEARLSRDLSSIPSYGPSQALSLSYSSLESGATGKFGVGWTSNLTQYLTFDITNGVTVWHRADGGRVPFGLIGSTWTPLRGHFETMTVSGGEVTITARDQTKYVFEDTGAGRLKRITNRFGKSLTIVWSASGATVTDASGRGPASGQTYNIVYDSTNGRITSFRDYANRLWSFGYTGTGTSSDLTTVTDPASKVTTLGYTSHALTTISRVRTKAAGGTETPVWTLAYTGGKATGFSDPELSTPNTFSYGAGSTTVNTVVAETGPVYAPRTYVFDDVGDGTVVGESATSDPDAGDEDSIIRAFDANLNLLSETVPTDDPAHAATTSSTYDTKGNVLTQTDPLDASSSLVTVSTYNATNDVLTRTDADNDSATRTVMKNTYDGSGHLTSVELNCTSSGTTIPGSGAGGACTGAGTQDASTNIITSYAYTSNDQLEYEQDPLGRVTKQIYDTYGNETSTIVDCTSSGATLPSPFSSCTAAGTHDGATNVTTGATFNTAVTAGKAGLPTTTTDALGRDTTYTYDALGRQLTEVNPADSSIPALTRTTSWDELGDVLTEADSWTSAGGSLQTRTTTHVYDLANRETSLSQPSGVKTATTYSPDGAAIAVIEQTSAGSTLTTTSTTFDLLSRPTGRTLDGSAFGSQATGIGYTGGVKVATTTTASAPTGVSTVTRTDFAGRTLSEQATPDPEDPVSGVTTTSTYDSLGRVLTSTDEAGVTTTNTYDRLGRLLATTVDGQTTTHGYDRAGNETSLTDPVGSVTTTTFDRLDRASSVIVNDVASPTLPSEDVTTTTSYDAVGNAVAVTDPRGYTTRTIVNAQGQPSETIANCTDSGTTPTSNPAACTGAGTHDDATNIVTDTTYDGQGNVVKVVSAVGRPAETTVETAYDADGHVQASKDAKGTITRNKYDTGGRLTDTYVDCTTTGTTVPSDWVNCTGAGTANGTYNLRTIYAYDEFGNQASVTAPNGRITSSVYDEAGRLSKTIDNDVASPSLPTDDVTTTFYYDDLDRQAAVRRPTADGASAVIDRTTFNDDGTVASQIRDCTDSGTTVPADEVAALACTGAGTKDADTNLITTYTYDDRGNRLTMTAPDPSATSGTSTATVTSQYAFDDADRLCRVVDDATGSTDVQALTHPCSDATQTSGTATTNVSTRYTYDGAGNLASMIDAAGHTTSYGYDASGAPASRTDADSGVLVRKYDALGRQVRQENRTDAPMSPSVTWTYDALGRMTGRTADSITTSYGYDLNGNRLTASDGTFTITAAYDRDDRVTTVDDEDAGTTPDTTYTYPTLATPTRVDVTGSYGFTLDRWDRATATDDPAMGTNFLAKYGTDGSPLLITRPDGDYTRSTYDKLGAAKDSTTSTTATGGTNRAVYTWTRNRAGQILTEAATVTGDPSNGTVTYAYDPLGRLTSQGMGTATTYAWDTVPNRTSVKIGAGTAATTTYDAADRPTSGATPTASYSNDADGRLTARPGQQLVWDRLGRIKQVKDGSGTLLASYTYDPLDRLRMIDDGAGTRIRFRYVGLTTAVAQWIDDATGTVTRSIGTGWSGERLLDWTGSGGNIRLYGENGHHDTTWLATSAGAVSQALRYDPWGTPRATVPSGYSPFRFQGAYTDDLRDTDNTNDLAWVITRWYAPALGRFLSEDSLLGEPIDPPSRSLYAYGQGDPVGTWDPDGRNAIRQFSFKNKAKLHGKLILGLFIRKQFNYTPEFMSDTGPARLYGDARGWADWAPPCGRSRACVTVNFDAQIIIVQVHDSCGDWYSPTGWWGYGCSKQFPIVTQRPTKTICVVSMPLGCQRVPGDDRYNLFQFSESPSGRLSLTWDITQSRLYIIRPDFTVNGSLTINPAIPNGPRHRGPQLIYKGDGFPSEELYWFSRPKRTGYTKRTTIFQHREGGYAEMNAGKGDWSTTMTMPQ